MRQLSIKPLLLLVFVLLTPAFSPLAQDKDSSAVKEKEVTILIDHYRAPCIDRFGPRWCYLLATAERPNEFPYFYGEIEEFDFQWGHQYRLLALRVDAPLFAPSPYNYRLVKILTDKKVRPQQRFGIALKLPLHPPFFDVDESSNIYLLGKVRIKTVNAKLKARLLRLLESAGPLDSISGDFRHDQKQEDTITLTYLSYSKP
jgi:hypothetical protein